MLSGAAQQSEQAGKASRLSDKSVKKQQEKKGKTRSSQREARSRQTLPSLEESTSTDIAVESAMQKTLLSRGTRHAKIQILVYTLPQVP